MNYSFVIAAPLLIAAVVATFRFVGCGIDADPLPLNPDDNGDGGDTQKPQKVTGNFSGQGVLAATVDFPGNDPETTLFADPGTTDYTIPYWCDTIDLILLGAGGGGMYAEFNVSHGGGAGDWTVVTIQRGSDIPWAITTLTVTIGAGGAGGTLGAPPGGPGGDTSVSWDTGTTTTETAAGGAAGASADNTGAATDPDSRSVGTAKLNGGGAQTTAGGAGIQPGGGGASGEGFTQGGDGADGAALIVARQNQ